MDNPLRIYDNFSEMIGCTPLVKLQRILDKNNILCQVWAKCEYLNPTASFGDRISRAITKQREKQEFNNQEILLDGRANTDAAVSLAFAAVSKNIQIKMTVSDHITNRQTDLLKALNVEILSNTQLNNDSSEAQDSNIEYDLKKDWYNILSEDVEIIEKEFNKFSAEIYQQMNHQVNYIFMLGTENEVESFARSFQNIDPHVIVVGIKSRFLLSNAESTQSPFKAATGKNPKSDQKFQNNSLVSTWIEIDSEEGLIGARELISNEGCIAGKFSGVAFSAAIKFLKEANMHVNRELKCVIVLNDFGREGLSPELTQEHMIGKCIYPLESFKSSQLDYFGGKLIKDFLSYFPLIPYLDKRLTVSDCLDLFNKNHSILPIRNSDKILGIITKASLVKSATKKTIHCLSSCINFIERDFFQLSSEAPMSLLQNCLENSVHIIVFDKKDEKTDLYSASLQSIFSIIQEKLSQVL